MTADRKIPLTAFPQSESLLQQQLAGAAVDVESLRRPLLRCDLAVCQGMCCHDGVYLEDDAVEVLRELVVREADFFRELGLRLPESVIVAGSFHGLVEGPKTASVPHVWRGRVENYPAHFPDTACCFLVEDGRCALQVLAETRGNHRWFWKPMGCWLHPLTTDLAPPCPIGLHDESSDPFRLPGYDGFVTRTFCGERCTEGPPARETLREELEFLEQIVK